MGMPITSKLLVHRAIWMLVLAGASCDDEPAECPDVDTAEMVCPVEIGPFEMSACGPVNDGPALPVGIEANLEGDAVHVTLTEVVFRDDNEICGFVERNADELVVLLQPCILSPGGVSKGDCMYSALSFDIDQIDIAGARSITILHRVDRSVELPPYPPQELASATLP
jgi:hypothetical protein